MTGKWAEIGQAARLLLFEQVERDRLGHGAIAFGRRMQRIPDIIARKQSVGMGGIAHRPVEIDHPVEIPRLANPAVDGLPVGFVAGVGMIIVVAHEGQYGSADHRSEEHTSELQSLMRTSYAVF